MDSLLTIHPNPHRLLHELCHQSVQRPTTGKGVPNIHILAYHLDMLICTLSGKLGLELQKLSKPAARSKEQVSKNTTMLSKCLYTFTFDFRFRSFITSP